jgi:hypothetical protein
MNRPKTSFVSSAVPRRFIVNCECQRTVPPSMSTSAR